MKMNYVETEMDRGRRKTHLAVPGTMKVYCGRKRWMRVMVLIGFVDCKLCERKRKKVEAAVHKK